MNREIKFRGLGIESPIWHYGLLMQTEVETDDGIFGTEYRIYHQKNDFMTYAAVDIKTVGQFIGLKDKNGVEIYEGDVVKSQYFLPSVVKYDSPFAMFVACDIGFLDVESTYDDIEWEVIGNIHQNPELLQEG